MYQGRGAHSPGMVTRHGSKGVVWSVQGVASTGKENLFHLCY
jgi:hypothetical protein